MLEQIEYMSFPESDRARSPAGVARAAELPTCEKRWVDFLSLCGEAGESCVPDPVARARLVAALSTRHAYSIIDAFFVGRLSDALFLVQKLGAPAKNPMVAWLESRDARILVRMVGGPTMLDSLQVDRIVAELGHHELPRVLGVEIPQPWVAPEPAESRDPEMTEAPFALELTIDVDLGEDEDDFEDEDAGMNFDDAETRLDFDENTEITHPSSPSLGPATLNSSEYSVL